MRHPLPTRPAALALVVLTLTLGVPRNVLAESPSVVYLKNGGEVHGELMEVVPDGYVTVRLADGTVRKVEWAGVARIERAPAGRAAAVGELTGPTARITVTSDKPGVTVKEVTGHVTVATGRGTAEGVTWKTLCMAPCTFQLSAGTHELIADGPGYVSVQKRFLLETGEHRLVARLASGAPRLGGAVLVGLGIACAITGGVFMAHGLPVHHIATPGSPSSTSSTTYPAPGWALPMLIAGLAGAGGGVAMFLLAGRSSFEPAGTAPATPTARSRPTPVVAYRGRF